MMKTSGKLAVCLVLTVLLSVLSACQTAYYKAYEKFGVYKRDLLKKNVEEVRNDQQKAAEQFKDALTQLKELYGFQGGDLEKMYDTLKAEFDKSSTKAEAVKARIAKVEQIAADLFKEWEAEIAGMNNATLASSSRTKLAETRQKYDNLATAMKRAEASMEPVLAQFKDQVTYLKHNLNAQAIGALKGETVDIEKEIGNLIQEMNTSIAQADAFIKGMD
jgi:DNA repair exonuclease SbcCD ATPase subunit